MSKVFSNFSGATFAYYGSILNKWQKVLIGAYVLKVGLFAKRGMECPSKEVDVGLING
jgi:hypothetical protein